MKIATLLALLLGCLCATAHADPLTPQAALEKARAAFRLHRPPPAYEEYTVRRDQRTVDGMPDLYWTYEYRVWCRTSDHSALGRRMFRGSPGRLEFLQPAFDEAADPGPPTSDLFELAPLRPRAAERETSIPLIGSVHAKYEAEYAAEQMVQMGDVFDIRLRPLRDPRRNRLRELWVDSQTFDIRQAVVVDRLFILGGPVYDQLDTLRMGWASGYPVITHIHSRAEFDRSSGDGLDVDYSFSDISFPMSLPDWYFVPSSYGEHIAQAPF